MGKFGADNFSESQWADFQIRTTLEYSPLTATVTNNQVATAEKSELTYSTNVAVTDNIVTSQAEKPKLEYYTILPLIRSVRELEQYDLTPVGILDSSSIDWEATVASDQNLIIEVSNDGGSTWTEVSNGDSLPFYSPGDYLLGETVNVRQILETSDGATTPSLEYFELRVRSKL